MIIEVMSKEHGDRKINAPTKQAVVQALRELPELDEKQGRSGKWQMHAKLKNGEQVMMYDIKDVEKKFDSIDTVLVRPTVVAG